MQLGHLVKELEQREGLRYLKPNSKGVYSLRVNHAHIVYFSASIDEQELFFYAPVQPLPVDEGERLDLYDAVLTMNLFGQGTGKAWFAKDPQNHQILLMSRLLLEHADVSSFLHGLQAFIEQWMHCKQVIKEPITLHGKQRLKHKHDFPRHHFV